MKKIKIIYLAAVLFICVLPLAGLTVSRNDETAENRALSEFPSVRQEDGSWNPEWLSQAGDYFQEHFAFRNEMVTANARIRSGLFGVSADDGVIDGTDGWLYYQDSLKDYLGNSFMGDRGIFNIAHSMAMVQEYAQNHNIEFLYVPVPNKNTLYGQHMPYYNQYKVSEEKNLENLYGMLDKEKVAYLNLYELFSDSEEILYHKTDSHWNNKGAAIAGCSILDALGKENTPYTDEPYTVKEDFEGDLEKMLYPSDVRPDEEIYYEKGHTYEYEGEISSTFDPKITTVNPQQQGSLVMYRDSFGNALLPFIADGFGNAYFSRSVPYPLTDLLVHQADTLIIERAERFLADTAKNPPVMPGLIRTSLPENAVLQGEFVIANDGEETQGAVLKTAGTYLQLDGKLDPQQTADESRVYIQLNGGVIYEAFPVTLQEEGRGNEYGYRLYFPVENANEVQQYAVRVFLS